MFIEMAVAFLLGFICGAGFLMSYARHWAKRFSTQFWATGVECYRQVRNECVESEDWWKQGGNSDE
jgi:hypothetical protein